MPDWAWFTIGAVGGAGAAAGAGYLWLMWYLARNNPM